MKTITEFAPAKINVSLKVGPLDKSSYHGLQSLVVFADSGDRLAFEPAHDLRLTIKGPFAKKLNAGQDNLVLRAARSLLATNNSKNGAHITLYKALPVSSGIGGGSADAAAALRGLNRLWNCGLSDTQLEILGRGLGADVPVCVQSRTRFMRGYGELLDDVSGWPELDAILVNPGFAVSTAKVFSRFDDLGLGQTLDSILFVLARSAEDALEHLENAGNALTPAACAEAPQIASLLDELAHCSQTRLARLCGSGATCVALVGSAQEAIRLASAVQTAHPKYWVQVVKLGASPILRQAQDEAE